ncbi:hypothetical protein E2C01_047986 [Portunus trituberculatus]|uniref:Uncharacterized protein n=1 Tax=Portunus trituberculatus TaxID=210409 RepID=A0A5B7G8Z1_PORTR|nr:hypothetical protein [Portunus trituberculatus]
MCDKARIVLHLQPLIHCVRMCPAAALPTNAKPTYTRQHHEQHASHTQHTIITHHQLTSPAATN